MSMRSMSFRRLAPLLPAIPALALSGCIKFGPEAPRTTIALSAESIAPPGDIGSGLGASALVVLEPETDRSLDVLRVPVQVTSASIAYLKDAGWIQPPARAFRGVLAETIRTRTHRLVFEGLDFDSGAKQILAGRLVRMGYDAPSHAVVVTYDAVLQEGGAALRTRRFEARVPNVPAKGVAVAPALNRAANEVAVQVADWLPAPAPATVPSAAPGMRTPAMVPATVPAGASSTPTPSGP